jgi:nickel/cobalt transporter (NicO) family protein
MTDPLFGSIVVTGLTVAFLHAALPTHWLPFVLAGRRQAWSHNKTLTIACIAGSGHVLFTIALGIAIAWFGITLDRLTGGVFPFVAAGILIAFGLYCLTRTGLGHDHFGHSHHHHSHGHGHVHEHGHDDRENGFDSGNFGLESERLAALDAVSPMPETSTLAPGRASDRAVIVGLLTALTLSPCEGFLPVFIAGARFGWAGFAVLCAVLAVATLAGMLSLTWLTLIGFKHAKFDRFERHENKVLGGLLISLGLAILILET